MGGTHFRLRHVVGAASLSCAALLAALSFGLPAAAQQTEAVATTTRSCPVLSLGNPNPGDNIFEGDTVISGIAYDPAATSGSGITRVDLFLGRRDEGGTFLGSAVPGNSEHPTIPDAFSTTVTIPSGINSQTDFTAYAISSVSGTETTVDFPIVVGTPARDRNALVSPTPTVNPVANVSNNCPQAPAGSQPAPAPGAPAPAPGAGAAANNCPELSLANPGPGDTLNAGDVFISGMATAPGGVTRVDLFLGQRDQGGTFLGSGIPGTGPASMPAAFTVKVTVPDLGHGADFAAYAIGSNGEEQATVFPVFVGTTPPRPAVGPTPTPVPQTMTVTSTCQ